MTSKTFSRQYELPKLPVPKLESTFAKYLQTIKPYVTDIEFAEKQELVKQALNDPEILRRQTELLKLHDEKDSWLADLWLNQCYLAWRAALPINSNVAGFVFGRHKKKWSRSFAAAAMTVGALRFHVGLLQGTVEINMRDGKPLCMDQYTRMFSLTRIPGHEIDTLRKYDNAKHIVVISRQRFYSVPVLNDQLEIVPTESLLRTFSEIYEDSVRRGAHQFPVAALTGTERSLWAKRRAILQQSHPRNAESLERIESAIFVVSLDEGVDETYEQCARSCFHGDGKSTWFDKSFQLKIKADGNPSIAIEHSWADAPVPLDMFFNHALPYAEGLSEKAVLEASGEVAPCPWSRIEWNLTTDIKSLIDAAVEEVAAAIADSDICIHESMGLGRQVWKESKLSPDAACQMAIQLAYRRMTNSEKPVATYETIGMTTWLQGRTECCKVVSVDSEAFVKDAMTGYLKTGKEEDRLRSEKLLRKACAAHIRYIVEGQQGHGIDRHFFGLRQMSKDGTQPKFFMDPTFGESGCTGGFIISSSNNSYVPRPLGGLFGAVMPNGYGTCYIPGAESVVLGIESKRSCNDTNSSKFAGYVDQSLRDVLRIAGVASSKL